MIWLDTATHGLKSVGLEAAGGVGWGRRRRGMTNGITPLALIPVSEAV